ncbi:MAG: HEAT repeat domain-containing protein [Planctomycetes bacterium]|nr:HEAT repeat domain-containing protein [Planctomycetota bacterium]
MSRFVDDHWEYRSKSGWKALADGAVLSSALESELLREWNTRRAALDLRDLAARVLLADWGATAGLMTEVLAELDATLTFEPDHVGAREVLKKHWFFSVPSLQGTADELAASEEELLRFGAAQTPSGRELAALELARHPEKSAFLPRLVRELHSNVVTRRSFATLVLRRVYPGQEARPLMMHAVLDASADVRQGSALALKAANEPALCVPILRAMKSRSPLVRTYAVEALGFMGYAAAVEPLVQSLSAAQSSGGGADRLPHSNIFIGRQVAYVQDFDVEVAMFQAVADPSVNVLIEGSVLDVAVAGELEMSFATESLAIQNSLAKLTNEMPGRSARAWLAWWEKNASKWRSEELSRPKTG